MYHADLLGGLAARMAGRMPLLWGIRNSTLDAKTSKRTTIQVVRLCARLSRLLPSRIICCSKEAMRIHIDLGYAAQKFVVIPNGLDLDLFKPDPAARREVRGELGVRDDAILIGLGARFDPQKDHLNFVEAASVLAARHANVEFVLWGDEITWDNHILADAIAKSGFGARFHLLGWRGDTSRLSAALDIGALSSAYGEAFPNVLGEIMACGVPCVATNVGDSALIIADTGRVVPIRDSQALTSGWEELISIGPDKRADLGAAARRRVQAHFKLSDVVSRYETVYLDLARRDLNIANAPNR
jgi:glycosyltransferase involved in cell wall biosynthesis